MSVGTYNSLLILSYTINWRNDASIIANSTQMKMLQGKHTLLCFYLFMWNQVLILVDGMKSWKCGN